MKFKNLLNSEKNSNPTYTKIVIQGDRRQYYLKGDLDISRILHLLYFKVDLLYSINYNAINYYYKNNIPIVDFKKISLINNIDNVLYYLKKNLNGINTISKYITYTSIKSYKGKQIFEFRHNVSNKIDYMEIQTKLSEYIKECNKTLLDAYRYVKYNQKNSEAKNG